MNNSLRAAAAVLMTAVSALVLTVAGPAGTASAGALDVTCTAPSSQTVTYTPPLTATPQTVDVDITTQYGPCVSSSEPDITSGFRTYTGREPARSCVDLLDNGVSTFTITWNTGQTSTVVANRVVTIAGAVMVATHTGTVTSGLFAGGTVIHVATGPSADVLLCTAGLGTVPGVYALVTLEISS